MTIGTRIGSFVMALLAVGCALSQDPAAPAKAAKKLRLHVVGASVSGGFEDGPLWGAAEQGDSVPLQWVLKAWCGEHARATTHPLEPMAQLFISPMELGRQQIDGAKKAKAEILVAVDFPFWFAYGEWTGKDEATGRKAKLAQGLELLATFDGPILVGDLPDMRGAAPRMLRASWIPSVALLAELNTQLETFVAARPNMRLVKLAALVKGMKTEGVALPLVDGALQAPPGAMLQSDRLHANRLGMAMLGFTVQPMLRDAFAKDHPLHAQNWTLDQFVEACGAGPDIADLRAAAAKPKSKAPAGAGG